ncbi:alpha-amylase family glycosyl hydrolase [Pseudoflavonifractor sp. An44]|uniref:alpha-amylase family glycosyl hydrolase n=1 Tax=Pseudoflavonifractor sp. An44 TaxID=1965635 RepID=UPI001FA8B03A|nr:alpha-amylase family glycosyl hydrolase [Pseudoflavonifractor sp. An44]
MENCFRYAGADCGELSMVFSFHHLKVDFMGNDKWVLVPTDFGKLKDILFSWQEGMAAHNAWNAVFWCNHDQPRVVSRFGDEGAYWKESAKMLANIVHAMRGTPYVYQGEELGMTNANFTSLDQYRDVESLNHFQILRDKGMSEESVYNILKVHSRDNSRTPMQWDATAQGGFTTGEPWISVNPNTATITRWRTKTPSSPTIRPSSACATSTTCSLRGTSPPSPRATPPCWPISASTRARS